MVAVCKLQSCTGTLPTACTTCATDYWHNQDAQSANLGTCSMCTACTAGTYESVDCLVVADRTCPSCTAVVDIATDADTAAEDGLDATTTCVSASSSRVSACRLGFFKTVGVDAVANAATCTGADDGAGTGTACALNTDSSACAVAGADCVYTSATVQETSDTCTACSTCAGGTFESAACTADSDTVCTVCDVVANIATQAVDNTDAVTTCVSADSTRVDFCTASFWKVAGDGEYMYTSNLHHNF